MWTRRTAAREGGIFLSWFKLDDSFFDNPKIAALSDAAQLAYVKGGIYCARNLTDGLIPTRKADEFAGKVIKELVPHLWEPVTGGYTVHDYLEYNPSKAQVTAEREKARNRKFGRSSGEPPANFNGTIRELRATYGQSS